MYMFLSLTSTDIIEVQLAYRQFLAGTSMMPNKLTFFQMFSYFSCWSPESQHFSTSKRIVYYFVLSSSLFFSLSPLHSLFIQEIFLVNICLSVHMLSQTGLLHKAFSVNSPWLISFQIFGFRQFTCYLKCSVLNEEVRIKFFKSSDSY